MSASYRITGSTSSGQFRSVHVLWRSLNVAATRWVDFIDDESLCVHLLTCQSDVSRSLLVVNTKQLFFLQQFCCWKSSHHFQARQPFQAYFSRNTSCLQAQDLKAYLYFCKWRNIRRVAMALECRPELGALCTVCNKRLKVEKFLKWTDM